MGHKKVFFQICLRTCWWNFQVPFEMSSPKMRQWRCTSIGSINSARHQPFVSMMFQRTPPEQKGVVNWSAHLEIFGTWRLRVTDIQNYVWIMQIQNYVTLFPIKSQHDWAEIPMWQRRHIELINLPKHIARGGASVTVKAGILWIHHLNLQAYM